MHFLKSRHTCLCRARPSSPACRVLECALPSSVPAKPLSLSSPPPACLCSVGSSQELQAVLGVLCSPQQLGLVPSVSPPSTD